MEAPETGCLLSLGQASLLLVSSTSNTCKVKTVLYLIPIFPLLLFTSCTKDGDGVIGTWELTEVYSDPGDGSGGFSSVDSRKQITFRPNGEFSAQGDFCSFSDEGDSQGEYFLETQTIAPDACGDRGIELRFDLPNNRTLIISYPCTEACQEKYRRR